MYLLKITDGRMTFKRNIPVVEMHFLTVGFCMEINVCHTYKHSELTDVVKM